MKELHCFGLYYDGNDSECKECSASELCYSVNLGIYSWNVALIHVLNYEPQNERESYEKDLLIQHIKSMIEEKVGKYKLKPYETKKENPEIQMVNEDAYKALVEASAAFGVDLSLIHENDIELLKQVIKEAHPYPITKFKLGGIKKSSNPRNPIEAIAMTIHLTFGNSIVFNFSVYNRQIYVGCVVKGVKGMKKIYLGNSFSAALKAIEKAKRYIASAKAGEVVESVLDTNE